MEKMKCTECGKPGRALVCRKCYVVVVARANAKLAGAPGVATYVEAKAHAAALAECERTGDALRTFPRGPMGLVTDEARANPEYEAARAAASRAFGTLRTFNAWYVKTFKAEIAAAHAARCKRAAPAVAE